MVRIRWWQQKMKRSHLIRLQNSDVFSVPPSLGLKALRQNSIISAGMEVNGLHPLSSHYAQNTIGETVEFTDWVQKVLNVNGKLPRRGSWNASTRNWERMQKEESLKLQGVKSQLVRNPFSPPPELWVVMCPAVSLPSTHVDAFVTENSDHRR